MKELLANFHFDHLSLCGEEVLLCAGREFRADPATAYIEAKCAQGLPVVTAYGMAMLPRVIARSAPSWEGKMVNVGHLVKSYDPKGINRDRIVGHVAAHEFPPEPEGGWVIPESRNEAPGCRLILAIHKAAEMVPGLFGKAQAGREPWTVSMEVRYRLNEGAWAWKRRYAGERLAPNSVDVGGGWDALPWDQCPPDLRDCYSDADSAVTKKWRGRDVVLLLGGLDGTVFFSGIALVNYGAEPGAEIKRLLAGRLDGKCPEDGAALRQLAASLQLANAAAALKPL